MTAVATLSFLSILLTAVISNQLHSWSPYSPIPKPPKPSVLCGEVLTEDTFLEGNWYCRRNSTDFLEPLFALRVTKAAKYSKPPTVQGCPIKVAPQWVNRETVKDLEYLATLTRQFLH